MSQPLIPADHVTSDRATELSEAHLTTLVHRFYDRVRIDPHLGPVFHAAVRDWSEHLDTMVRFWSTIMLGTSTYKGNPLAAHQGLPLTPSMFDRWLTLWIATTEELFVPACASALQQKAYRMGQNLQFALFGGRDRSAVAQPE